jgi:hypothetical protein
LGPRWSRGHFGWRAWAPKSQLGRLKRRRGAKDDF